MSSLKYDILSWLNVTGRVRVDNTNTESESRFHASGQDSFTQELMAMVYTIIPWVVTNKPT